MTSHSPSGSTPPQNGGNGSGRPLTQGPIRLSPGTVLIGTYEIIAHINTGGMGEIYRGRNIHNDEPVAIKIVLPALAHDEKILSLFQKESTVLRRIAHDAIVRYEVFTIDPSIARPCLVMEFVDGVALSDHTEGAPLPEQQVLSLIVRLADGLQVAHRAGVVHRDLSPDNVILRDDDVDTAKIIDFGIAKETTSGGGTLIGGQFAGKPGYVAPEQLGLYEGQVTAQADVYSLGLLAAASALGRPLDMGDNPADAVRARMDVPDLSALPGRLRGVLSWMLQPDPANRPDGMAGVVAAGGELSHPPQMPPQRSQGPGAPGMSVPPGTTPPIQGISAPEATTTATADDGSPFGPPPTVTSASPEQTAQPRARRWTPGLALLALLAVVALAGGGAWYVGLLPRPSVAPGATLAAQSAWLAERHSAYIGSCRYLEPASSVPAGADALHLQGFAQAGHAFAALRQDFEQAQGTAPTVDVTAVAPAQCGALDFLSGLALPIARDLGLFVLPDTARQAGDPPASGRLIGRGDDTIALLLIGPGGRLQNVTSELEADGTYSLPRRRLRLTDSQQPADSAHFLVMALSSESPLGTVSLIPENAILPSAQVGDFWRFLKRDIENAGGDVRAGLSAVPASSS